MRRYTSVIFDAFGTLIRPVPRRVSAHSRLAAAVPPERFPSRDEILTRNIIIEELAGQLGRPDLAPLLRRDIDTEVAQLKLFEDVADVLRRLRAEGKKIGVCSNLSADYGPAVRALLPNLDAYVFSYEVGARKPAPGIFEAACAALRCYPRDVLFIGDSERSDVEGPTRFGMTARRIDRTKFGLENLLGELRLPGRGS